MTQETRIITIHSCYDCPYVIRGFGLKKWRCGHPAVHDADNWLIVTTHTAKRTYHSKCPIPTPDRETEE